MRAAHDDAAGGIAAALAACTTDHAALGRVAAILRGEVGGMPVLNGYEPLTLALPVPVRRSATVLEHTRGPR